MLDTKFENLQCSLLDSVSQSRPDTNRCNRRGKGCSMSRDVNRGAIVKGGTVVTHKCVGTKSSKISTFDLQQSQIFKSSSFSNRQHHCPTLPCKNGETGKQMLLKISKEIWQYVLKHQITITTKYLPNSLNMGADWQSQNSRDPSEWKLSPKVFQKVCQRRGMLKGDLFASRLSHQLLQYFARKPNPFSQGTDAQQQIWGNQFLYAFNPILPYSTNLGETDS